MIRQLFLFSCLFPLVYTACKTVGPALGGSCPPDLTLVHHEGKEECAYPAEVAACGGAATRPAGAGCVDTDKNCPNWAEKGYCTSSMYTTEQKKTNCAKSCNLCRGADL